jgi:hypothetical protein
MIPLHVQMSSSHFIINFSFRARWAPEPISTFSKEKSQFFLPGFKQKHPTP